MNDRYKLLNATIKTKSLIRAQMIDILCENHGYDSALTSDTEVAVDVPVERKQAFINIIEGCGMQRIKLNWS